MNCKAILALTLLAAGCQQMGTSSRRGGALDDGLLQYVSADARSEIKVARIEYIEAQDATAAAEHQERHSVDDRRVILAELRAANDRVAREEERRTLSAELESDPERMAACDDAVSSARSGVEQAEMRLALHDARAEVLAAQVTLNRAEEEHAAAVVDLRKARALAALERSETSTIDVEAYERAERECETEIELAKTVLRAAQREVMIAEERVGD